MEEINFLEKYQNSTKRNYIQRVVDYDKAACAKKAKEWGFDYWDGDRGYGYGGYKYDGRWNAIARDIAKHYNLKPRDRILDIGCGKGFLLYEFTQAVPGIEVAGLDISQYAKDNAKEEVKNCIKVGDCTSLPWEDKSFDFVYSINTFHNLSIEDLHLAIKEMERVGKNAKWCCVESYKNEEEKANLLYWQLTCESFFRPNAWQWIFKNCGYKGDVGFIYFN